MHALKGYTNIKVFNTKLFASLSQLWAGFQNQWSNPELTVKQIEIKKSTQSFTQRPILMTGGSFELL